MAIIFLFYQKWGKKYKEDNYRLENQVKIILEDIRKNKDKLNDNENNSYFISVGSEEDQDIIIKNELIGTNTLKYNRNRLKFNNYSYRFGSFYFFMLL